MPSLMAAPTDPHELLTFHMIRAHSTFKVGFDNIATHLDHPPTNDLKNFLGYCKAWAGSIQGHHTSEEKLVFPFLNQKLDFSQEVEQHKIIHGWLDAVIDFIRAAEADQSKFDATKLKRLMDALRDPLFTHLDSEVEHIAPANLKAFKGDDMAKLLKKLQAHAKATVDSYTSVPFICSHTPPEWKDSWPGFPWIIRKIAIPYIFAKRHSGYWKYSPYGMT